MILPFVFLPFVFINLLRQIFVSISNFSYVYCCDKPMSSLNQQSEPLKLKNVSSLVLVFSKYVNSDKKSSRRSAHSSRAKVQKSCSALPGHCLP